VSVGGFISGERCEVDLKRFFGDLPLAEITSQKIDAYISMRTKEGIIRGGKNSDTRKVSRSTVANELATL
jgi:hypothetical protein